jgi:hypothetical protein
VTHTSGKAPFSEVASKKKPTVTEPSSSKDAAALLAAHAPGPWVAAFGASIELEGRKPAIAPADAANTDSANSADANKSDCAPLSDPEMWAALEGAVTVAIAADEASARATKWANHRAFRLRAGLADPGPNPPPSAEKDALGAKNAPANTSASSGNTGNAESSSGTGTRGLWWKIRAENLRTAAGESEIHPSKRPTSRYTRKGPGI